MCMHAWGITDFFFVPCILFLRHLKMGDDTNYQKSNNKDVIQINVVESRVIRHLWLGTKYSFFLPLSLSLSVPFLLIIGRLINYDSRRKVISRFEGVDYTINSFLLTTSTTISEHSHFSVTFASFSFHSIVY